MPTITLPFKLQDKVAWNETKAADLELLSMPAELHKAVVEYLIFWTI
jgi:hypothetical protein